MFDVITFGSATKDIFLSTKESTVIESDKLSSGVGMCFPMGSKVKTDEIYFTSGGGGTNSAVTFAKQGFQVAYCGKIGYDSVGENIVNDLKQYGISTNFVSKTKEKLTNHSVVIDVPGVDRTIFVYRGAAELHNENDISFSKLMSRWFYLAPFSPYAESLFCRLIEFAVENNIKIMANPSKRQLQSKKTKEVLKNVDILLLNAEEASILTGTPLSDFNTIIEKTTNFTKNIILITQGVDGVTAFCDNVFYKAKPVNPDAIDRTGAGDSFGSGFLSEFMRSGDVKKAIQLGVANSTSCLQKKGAKNGLLNKDDYYSESPLIESDNILNLQW